MTTSFEWGASGNGYRILGTEKERRICKVVGPKGVRFYRPFEVPALYKVFSTTESNEDGILEFAARFGLLGLKWATDGEPIDFWIDRIMEMRETVAAWEATWQEEAANGLKGDIFESLDRNLTRSWLSDRENLFRYGDRSSLYELQAAYVPVMATLLYVGARKDGVEAPPVHASNLLHALWIQFAAAVALNARVRRCSGCKGWIENSLSFKRSHAQFCNETCRLRAYKQRKRDAYEMHAAGHSCQFISEGTGIPLATLKRWFTTKKTGKHQLPE